MKPTIIFSIDKNNFSKFYRKSLGLRCSHVAFGIVKNNISYIFHTSFRKVCFSKREKFEKYNDIIAEYEIVPDISKELDELKIHLGSKYDAFAAFLLNLTYWIPLLRFILIKCKIRPNFYCGNFIRQVDKKNIIKSWSNIDLHWVSPDDLLRVCENSSEFIKI